MKVFLTGIDGYIGCVLAPMLLDEGFDVVALDTGYYRDGWLYSDPARISRMPLTLIKDLRQVDKNDLAGCDAVVHLAELSNDPLGENNPAITHDINHHGSVNLAKLARSIGVKRFVYTSSCSVYGLGSGDFLDESSDVNPQTAYADCKVLVEQDVSKLATDEFSPVFLRNATAYGASPRMRFDIVLNNLCGFAWTTERIVMTSDGTPWRPIVHVEDICRAIICSLKAPVDSIHNETFNVGNTDANYRIREIAEIVADIFPGCKLEIGPPGGDNRSYRVNCDKIADKLPDFDCAWTPERGARQLLSIFESIDMRQSIFDFRAFTRLKQLTYLQQTGQLDESFFWKNSVSTA
jgi:nucleoside-diphosphate-sugar epimerase